MSKILRNTVAVAICMCLAGSTLGYAWQNNLPGSSPGARIAQVSSTNKVFEIENAVLQLMDMRNIPAQANGILSNVKVIEGQLVKQNQLLAKIDDREAGELLREAAIEHEIAQERMNSNVEIEFAQKSKEVAEADYRRGVESNREYSDIVSPTEMDQLRLRVDKSAAEIDKISFEQRMLQKTALQKESIKRQREIELSRHEIRSSIDGVIMEINSHQGEWVNRSDTVFKVVRLNRLRIEEYLPSAIAHQNLVGAVAEFNCTSPGRDAQVFPGKVVFVHPDENPLNQTVRVWIEVDNPRLALKAGMKGRVVIRQK